MTTVFLLFHSHDLGEGEADDKLIGVYLSREDAQQAQERAALLDGFINVPDGFVISAYKLGEDHWTKGYITVVAGRPVARGDQS